MINFLRELLYYGTIIFFAVAIFLVVTWFLVSVVKLGRDE